MYDQNPVKLEYLSINQYLTLECLDAPPPPPQQSQKY